MNIGMLWFDNDPKAEINTKIERAASYYRNKYGKSPNLCFVHPTMVRSQDAGLPTDQQPVQAVKTSAIEVRTSRSVLPNHFWLGIHND
jgi:hypothetical protein